MGEETREIQFLRAARGAISAGEIKEAMSLYEMAFNEDSENPEAKYFYHFNDFINCFERGEELKYPILYLINSLEFAVKYIAEFDCSNYEKSVVITTMISTYNIVFDYVVEAYNILGVDLIDDYIIGLYWLGSYIKRDFEEEPDFVEFAVGPWERAIELHQEYGCKHENYKVEDCAEELKKIKPHYVIPAKPDENARERITREKAEQEKQRAREEAERAEKKAREEAERAEKKAREEAERAEKKAREEAERAEKKAREEAERAEKKAREEADAKAQKEKEKIQLIIIAAVLVAVVVVGGLLPYLSS